MLSTCSRCGRGLSDPISRAQGMGPTCLAKMGLSTKEARRPRPKTKAQLDLFEHPETPLVEPDA